VPPGESGTAGKLIVHDDVIELCGGLVVPTAPSLSAVEADGSALPRSEDHAGRVPGIDPHLVIVISARRTTNDRGFGRRSE
jgi:hypothetical protein